LKKFSSHHRMKRLVSLKENKKDGVETTKLTVSVIIPTYNRKDLLRETLNSLAKQTYPSDHFEIIVVDDGSTDGTASIVAEVFPFILRYFWQSNQGDASARNLGVQQSQADILVFLDDDILVEADYLTYLIQAYDMGQNNIVIGTCNLSLLETTPFSKSLHASQELDYLHTATEVSFRDVYSNNMALRREAYFKIGMMQGLDFPGSSMWCDLDFNYRAYQQGFRFFCSAKAVCWHRDYTVNSFDTHKKRMSTAAYRAVVLLQKYPELLAHVPMFDDKTPIIWGQDPPSLIARKLVRSVASSRLALWSMERLVSTLEKRYPTSRTLRLLYRYIIGGYIYKGYREGLREFGPINNLGGLH
jgi:glycosyltransferase involved in cell wall biosynthesis